MAATTTLIDAKRVLRDGTSYRVQAHIDQEALARLVGQLTVQAAEEGGIALAEGALVITAEPAGKVSAEQMEALRREMQARLPDAEEGDFLPL
jgi:microcystin degradation protein MlrC